MIAGVVGACDGRPFGYSRALEPEIRRELRRLPAAQELPAIRGRTVIPADYRHPVVAGHPNYLGAFERVGESSTRLICLTGAWSALQPVPEGAATVVAHPSHARQVATSALEDARRLGKLAKQIPGVHLAFKPKSPILILLLPRAVVSSALPETMIALDGEYPELPGGLRIELTPDVTTMGITRYAAIIEQVVSQEA